MKKRLVLIAVLAILALVIAACGSDAGGAGGTATPTTPPAAGNQPADQTPAPTGDGERPVLTIGVQSSIIAEDFETNWMTRYIEEALGIDLRFQLYAAELADARAQFRLDVAGGMTLPDVIMFDFVEMELFQFAQMGVFQPLSQFINDPEVAVNINLMSESDRDFALTNIRMPDGEYYHLFEYVQFHWSEGHNRAWINQEWLDELNLPMPTTTEELYDTLTAFLAVDPSRIGMVGTMPGSGWGTQLLPFMMSPFTYVNPGRQWLHVENGEVYASFTRPEWVEGLRFLNRMFNSGLIDPMSFTQTEPELRAIAMADEAMAGMIFAGSAGLFGNMGPTMDRMMLMPPLYGPEGENNAPMQILLPTPRWHVTRDAADPALAVMVGDFLLSDYMSAVAQFGEYGYHWTMDEEITSQWVGQYFDPPTFVVFPERTVWGVPGNTIWGTGTRFERWEFREGRAFVPIDEVDTTPLRNWQGMHLEHYVPRFPAENIGRRVWTGEEMEELAIIQTNLMTHLDTNNAMFITGQRSIDEFDMFLAEMDALGLDRFIELSQIGHDRNQ